MLDGLAVCMVLQYWQFLLVFAMVEAGSPVPNLVSTISKALWSPILEFGSVASTGSLTFASVEIGINGPEHIHVVQVGNSG